MHVTRCCPLFLFLYLHGELKEVRYVWSVVLAQPAQMVPKMRTISKHQIINNLLVGGLIVASLILYSPHHINNIINRRMSASVLSMDSPSFRPHVGGGVGGLGGTSPHHQRHRSRTSSPLSHGSNPSGGGGGEGHSNALKSYSFQTPTGYVFYGEYIWWPTYLSICPSYNFLINIIST